VAIVLLVLLIGGGAMLLLSWLKPSGQMLTVTRPSGGTLTGSGIRCGTQGGDCSARRPNGETVELTAQADNGFVFRGYTGDCAPGGLMIMSGAKTCGATFELLPAGTTAANGPTQTLTISPVPSGGTLEGVDILCGTKGSICSANHPDGVPVELHPTADPGFTFMGFIGDCAPLGHTQMTGARTCGANFQSTDSLKPGKPLPDRIARDNTIRTPPPPPTSGTPPGPTGSQGPRGGAPTGGAAKPPETPATPPVAPPSQGGTTVPPPANAQGADAVKAPISDDDYARNAVKDVLKEYCAAYEALDPDAVQRIYP